MALRLHLGGATCAGSSTRFVVATYHMPCLFGSDEKCQTMVMHASWLLQYAQKWAGGLPLVVAGDFNLKPQDATYTVRAAHRPYSSCHLHSPKGPTYLGQRVHQSSLNWTESRDMTGHQQYQQQQQLPKLHHQ